MMKKINNLLTAVFVAVFFVSGFSLRAADAVTLYGVKTYCEEGCSSGLYTLEARPGAEPELYWADGDMMGNGGAVYVDGKLYVLNYLDFYGTLYWSYLVCDIEKKEYEYMMPELEFSDVGSASAYDPTTGNTYWICIDADDTSKFTLSTMDISTGKKSPVARIERMHAMAIDAKGVLYGIGADGNLYTIDKATAKTTLVGSTGVIPKTNQSAVIDYATGVMYWSAWTENGGALYMVDVSTGQATLVSTYGYQLVGLFIKQELKNEGAPRPVEDLSLAFTADNLSGRVCFTLPTEDVDGNKLGSEVGFTISLNGGAPIVSDRAEPGIDVAAAVTVPADGNYQFVVKAVNGSTESNAVNVSAWIGHDAPATVDNCNLELDGYDASLSWELPSKGRNGGYVNPAKVKYDVIRGPYATTIATALEATTFTDRYEIEGVHPLMYGVVPVSGDVKGEMAISNVEIIGDYWTPPFTEDLTDPFRQLIVDAIDANGDECTWVFDDDESAMRCNWPFEETSDDWMILPAVRLEADKYYKVKLTLRSEGKWNYESEMFEDVYAGTLSLMMGEGREPNALSTEVIAPWDVINRQKHVVESLPFTVDNDCVRHFALHHTGPRSIYYTYIYKFEMEPTDPNALHNIDSNAPFSVAADGCVLTIDNPEGLVVRVATIDGRIMATVTEPTAAIRLPGGIYIVSSGSQAVKVKL